MTEYVPAEPRQPPAEEKATEVTRRAIPVPTAPEGAFVSDGVFLRPAAPPVEQAKVPSLWSIFRFKWTMILVFVLVAAPSIAAVWAFVTPWYSAGGEIRVRPTIPRLVFRTEDNGVIPLYDSYRNTQVAVLLSPAVLKRVLERPAVRQTLWYKNSTGPLGDGWEQRPTSPRERLREALAIGLRPRTEIIDVGMTTHDGGDSAVIVNAVLDEYIAHIGEVSGQTRDAMFRNLRAQHDALRDELDRREQTAAGLRKDLGTGEPQELVAKRKVRLDKAEAHLDELDFEMLVLDWKRKEVKSLIDAELATQPSLRPKPHEDAEWRRLDTALKIAQHNLESATGFIQSTQHESAFARGGLKDNHPKMVSLKRDVEFARQLLKQREEQLFEFWKTHPHLPYPEMGRIGAYYWYTDYRTELTGTQRKLNLRKYERDLGVVEAKKLRAEYDRTFRLAQLLDKENGAIRHKRELYLAVRDRLDKKEMERNVPGSIEILARAAAPSRPMSDRRRALTGIALVGAMLAAGTIAFVRSSRAQVMYEAEDMPQSLLTSILGQLPLVGRRRRWVREDDPSLIEGVRMIRTVLLSRLTDRRGVAVLVSSARKGTGKSTVAVMLAKSLARCGRRVLLIDADLRGASVSGHFKLAAESGLVESIGPQTEEAQTVFPTDLPQLSVMPVGHHERRSEVELMADGAFAAFMQRLRREYEFILLDCSPILPVADARILAQHVDGTIIVVRQERCRRPDLVRALASLNSSGGKLLGTIFIGSTRHGL